MQQSFIREYARSIASKHLYTYQQTVTENNEAKILWDFDIRSDRVVKARRPDIVILDKKSGELTIVDLAVPAHANIKERVGKDKQMIGSGDRVTANVECEGKSGTCGS